MPSLTIGHKTDIGHVRKMNQDALAVLAREELGGFADGLYVVADGMGGRAGGEVAAGITVKAVPEVVNEVLAEGGPLTDAMREGLLAANEDVYREARARTELRGMATTCVAVLIREDTAIVGNVGDSRVYLLRGSDFQAITHDHSLVQEYVRQGEMSSQEARGSRFRNVITRGIGLTSTVEPDVATIHLESGDTLLLCTDGLTGMLEDEEIARLLARTADAQAASEQLVDAANTRGGRDNTTVVVVRYGDFAPIDLPAYEPARDEGDLRPVRRDRRTRRQGSGVNALLVGLVLVLLGALLYVGAGHYTLTASWPFLHEQNAVEKPPPAPATTDYANLTWDPPKLLAKGLRGAPLACDGAGNVYAVSTTDRLVRIAPDGKRSSNPAAAVVPSAVEADSHMAVDPHGFVYISSRRAHSIARYDAQGTRKGFIQKGLKAPEGLAVDAACDIYVVDGGQLKVLRAHPAETGTAAPAGTGAGTGEPERGDGSR